MDIYQSQAFIELKALDVLARRHQGDCHDAECRVSLGGDIKMLATRLATLVLPHEQPAALALVNTWPR